MVQEGGAGHSFRNGTECSLPHCQLLLLPCRSLTTLPPNLPACSLQGGKRAIVVMRPRGWHLWEHHVLVDGQAVPGEWRLLGGWVGERVSGRL